MEIQDGVRTALPDQKSFELYMFRIEGLCRQAVTTAMKTAEGEPDQQWASAICANVDAQLLAG